MTDKERLTNIIHNAQNKYLNLLKFESSILADYLLANGVIVPPCKVGQTLYVILKMKDKRILPFVNEYEATFIQLGKRKCKVYYEKDGFIKIFLQDDFGETVFLTREEAEKALKEREKNA